MLRLFRFLMPLTVLPLMGAVTAPDATPQAAPIGPICHTETKPSTAPPATALLMGYGTGGFPITTTSPEAQAYFNNGMQLAHAFAHGAATSAFKRAEQLDPTCAMCVWGEAWSRGPTINYGIDKKEQADLVGLVDKAALLAERNPAKERALIAALKLRYRNSGGQGPGDNAFAVAMDALTAADPADIETAVMAADAWMIPAANSGTQAHLDRAIEILEGTLKRAPNDTGAIHFYIHATEMNGVGTKALPYAEKLQALAPAASHLVHMPSHTYFWAGRYRMAEQSNLDAVEIDKANAARLHIKDGAFGLGYHGHNVWYGEAAALMAGDAQGGLSLAASELQQIPSMKPENAYPQMALGAAYFVYGRLGSDADMATLADPAKLPLARAMWHYAKGENAARHGDARAVRDEAAAVSVAPADLKAFGDSAPRAKALVDIAHQVLIGRAAMLEKNYADAEAAYRKAADIQDTQLGSFGDPPAWWYPVRRSVAAALEAEGKPEAAADEARKVMTRWYYDPVSLKILADSDAAEGHSDEAKRQLNYARANWSGDISAMPEALE